MDVRFRAALDERPDLIPAGGRILLAYSGGSDSTALLHLLLAIRAERQLDLHAVHFDHGLREASAADARRAREACEAVGVPCRSERATGLGASQAECREARYRFLRREAARLGADRIALAHQRDDHLETVLLRLQRGTGLRGLAGIPARRGAIVRPLLGFGREELRAYLREEGVVWHRDPANRNPRYARSRVRHRLLPALAAVSDGVAASRLAELAQNARTADDGLDRRAAARATAAVVDGRKAANGAQIARSILLGYDRAERARILRKLARDLGFRLGRRGTAVAVAFISDGASGHGVDVAKGLRVSREYDRILVGPPTSLPGDRELEISGRAPGSERLALGGRTYAVRWGVAAPSSEWAVRLRLDDSAFPLRLRGPRPGDRIRTRVGSRKLKKVLNERRVPRSHRCAVPVLVGADERVLWVVGHEVASDGGRGPDEETFTIAVSES